MVKKTREEFDDMEFDNFPDLDGGEFGDMSPGADKRSPFMKVAGGAAGGAWDYATTPSNQMRFIKRALPDGYTRAIDTADMVTSTAGQLYDTVLKESAPVLRDAKKLARTIVPRQSMFIPDGLQKKLNELLDDQEDNKRLSQVNAEESAITSTLAEVFKAQAQEKAKEDTTKDAVDTQRHVMGVVQSKSQIDQLVAIRNYMGQLVSYQDQVTANVQRKSLEVQYRSYFVQRKMLEEAQKFYGEATNLYKGILHNTGLPEAKKVKANELAGMMIKQRVLGNIGSWFSGLGAKVVRSARSDLQGFFQNLGSSLQDGLMASEMIKESAEYTPGGMHAIGGSFLGQMGAEWLANKAIKPLKKHLEKNKQVMDLGHKLNRGVTNLPYQVSQWAGDMFKSVIPESMRGGFASMIEDAVKGYIGGAHKKDTTVIQQSGMDKLDEMVYFNLQTRKTITDVIPGWLSRIHNELNIIRTGDSSATPLHYSFESGEFESSQGTSERIKRKIFRKDVRDNVKEQLDKLMVKMGAGPNSSELNQKEKAALQNIFLQIAQSDDEHFDIEKIVNETYTDSFGVVDNSEGQYLRDKYKVSPEVAISLQQFMRKRYGYKNYEGVASEHVKNSAQDRDEDTQLFEYMRKQYPDIMETLQQHGKYDPEELKRLGILERQGTTWKLNRKKFYEILHTGEVYDYKSSNNLIATATHDNRLAGFLGGSGAQPIASPAGLGGGMAPPQPSGGSSIVPSSVNLGTDTMDRLETMVKELQEAFNQAIIQNSSKPLTDVSNQKLDEIIRTMQDATTMLLQGAMGPPQPGGATPMHWADRGIHGGMNALKWGKNQLGAAWRSGGKAMDFLYRKGTGAIGWGMNQGIRAINWADKTKLSDIIAQGRSGVALSVEKLKEGKYVDRVTGKVITSWDEIKGAVDERMPDGNLQQVLSAEELKNIYDRHGKPIVLKAVGAIKGLWNKISSPFRTGIDFAKTVGKNIYRFIKAPEDIYVVGEMDKPRLYAWLIQSDGYILKTAQVPIKGVHDINDDILDKAGNTVLTMDEVNKKGLCDRLGKPFPTMKQRVNKAIGWGVKSAVGLWAKGGQALGWLKEKAGQSWDFLKGLFGGGDGGVGDKKFGLFGKSKQLQVLEDIYSLLDARMPNPQGPNSFMGPLLPATERHRQGSWKDEVEEEKARRDQEVAEEARTESRKQTKLLDKLRALFQRNDEREEDRDEQDDRTPGILSALMPGPLKSLVGKLKGAGPTAIGTALGSTIGGLMSGLGSALKWGALIAGGVGAISWLRKKAVGAMGGEAEAGITKGDVAGGVAAAGLVGTKAGRGLLGRAGGALARGAGHAAIRALPWAMTATGTALGWMGTAGMALFTAPVLVPAAILAGAYGLAKSFEYLLRPTAYLTRFRMFQYGFSPGWFDKAQSSDTDKIAKLEMMLKPVVMCSKGKPATLGTGVSVEEVAAIFDITEESSKEEVQQWIIWFTQRFKPVYLAHMAALFNVTGKKDIDREDDILNTDEMINVMKQVHFRGNATPYAIRVSPFAKSTANTLTLGLFGNSGELDIGPEEVNAMYDELLDKIDADRTAQDARASVGKNSKGPGKGFWSETWDDIKDKASKGWKATKEGVSNAWDKTLNFGKSLIPDSWSKNISSMVAEAKRFGDSMIKVGGKIIGTDVKAVMDAKKTVSNYLTGLYKDATGGAAGAGKGYFDRQVFSDPSVNKNFMLKEAIAAGITDPKELAMLMAQLHVESGGFKVLEENLNYSVDGLLKNSKRAQRAGRMAVQTAVGGGAEGVAELMYGGRMGNSKEGDGYRYRGRGFIQLTGKEMYERAGKGIKMDLVNNPDLAADPIIASKIALWYWRDRVGDAGGSADVTKVTKRINGGTNGLAERENAFAQFYNQALAGKLVPTDIKTAPVGATPSADGGIKVPPVAAMPVVAPTTKPAITKVTVAAAPVTAPAAKPAAPAAPTATPSTTTAKSTPTAAPAAAAAASDAAVAKAKETEETNAKRAEVQQRASADKSQQSMADVVDILQRQLEHSSSMDASLIEAVKVLRDVKTAIDKIPASVSLAAAADAEAVARSRNTGRSNGPQKPAPVAMNKRP